MFITRFSFRFFFIFKQIELDQHKTVEHDMAICQKRREEFISLLQTFYDMTWPNYFDLTDLQTKIKDIFHVDHLFHSFQRIICSFC